MAAHQAPPSLGFSRQEHWSGLPFPSPIQESEKWKWSYSVVSDSSRPHGLKSTRLLRPWDFPGKSTRVGCHCLLPLQPTRLQKIQILHRDGAKKFSASTGEILYCFLKKAWGGALLSTSMWIGSGPCSRQKSLKNIPSGTVPLWMEQPALNKTIEWLHFMTDFKS